MSALQTQIVKLKLETVHIVLRNMPPAGGVVNDETGYVPEEFFELRIGASLVHYEAYNYLKLEVYLR